LPPLTVAPIPELVVFGVGVAVGLELEVLLVGLFEQATASQTTELKINPSHSIFFIVIPLR